MQKEDVTAAHLERFQQREEFFFLLPVLFYEGEAAKNPSEEVQVLHLRRVMSGVIARK